MKKLTIILLIIMVIFAGCNTEPADINGNNTNRDSLEDFRSHIEQQFENPSEIKAYLDQLLEDADTTISDELILEYLCYMDRILTVDAKNILVYPEDAGFKYVSNEGAAYPVIDYHFIDAYSEQISQEIKDFAEFMALNSDTPWAMDASISIPIKDLADRIALAEQFITNYPSSVLKDTVKLQFEYYLNALLAGTDNTPLFQFDTYTADFEFIEAYEYLLKTYPELEVTNTVENFQLELEAINYKAPYTYTEYDKRAKFKEHINELVKNTISQLDN
ncbi:MAG: hypothetical protein ACOX4V_00165 [Anaerovoracaceae bacterium]|jgi:hypothetical protein